MPSIGSIFLLYKRNISHIEESIKTKEPSPCPIRAWPVEEKGKIVEKRLQKRCKTQGHCVIVA